MMKEFDTIWLTHGISLMRCERRPGGVMDCTMARYGRAVVAGEPGIETVAHSLPETIADEFLSPWVPVFGEIPPVWRDRHRAILEMKR